MKEIKDDEVKLLIEEYIICSGDFAEFYRKICDFELGYGDEEAETYLDIIPKAILKYILDNVIEFIEYCNKRQVRIINDVRKIFAKQIEFGESSYKQNINFGQIGYGIHISVVKELIKPLKQFMEENSQRAFPEMIANYKKVCQIHGGLKQDEEKNDKEKEKTLEQLEQELQKLQKQDRRTTQQRDASKLLKNAYQAELEKKMKLVN